MLKAMRGKIVSVPPFGATGETAAAEIIPLAAKRG
jgi:hypothetical protein